MAEKKTPAPAPTDFREHLRDFAHEIGTPLNAMMGYSQMTRIELAGDRDLEKIGKYNAVIEEATRRLLRICERVLDDAVSGEHKVVKTPVDMTGVAAGVIETFEEMAHERGIKMLMEFADDFPMLETDPVLIEQVLTNLVSNAIKFTPRGGSITIRGELDPMNNAMILLVRDTGSGIPADLMLKIRNGDTVSTDGEHGDKSWGRGLQIARRICDRLGAELVFAPADNGGTVVRICLPVADESSPAS